MGNAEYTGRDNDPVVPVRRQQVVVVVGSLTIEAGELAPPVVGQVAWLRVSFVELGPDETHAADETEVAVSVLSARAEPWGDGTPWGPGRQWDGTPNEGPVTWPTILHGDGWSGDLVGAAPGDRAGPAARPAGRRPRRRRPDRGPGSGHPRAGPQRHDRHQRPRLAALAPGPRRAAAARRRGRPALVRRRSGHPTRGSRPRLLLPGAGDPWVREIGVVVDLDLDRVPALPPRLRLVPGALAAAGGDLWVVDSRLPLLLRVRRPLDPRPEVEEFSWPGRILTADEAPFRALHADPDGCWITGPDGVHRADDEHGVVEVDPRATAGTATHDGLLAAVVFPDTPTGTGARAESGQGRWLRRWRPDGAVLADVDLGEGHVEGLVATRDGGFLALRRHLPPDVPVVATRQPTRLTAIGPDGAVTHGPTQKIGGSMHAPLLAADPPVVDDSRGRPPALRRVRSDLTVDEGASLRRIVLGGYAAEGRLWVQLHPPHRDDLARGGPDACWPLSAPPRYEDDRQHWLLTELDPVSLEPLVSHLVPQHPRHVAVDDNGRVWVTADGLRHLPPRDGATAQLFDLEPLLDPAATGGADPSS